MTSSCSCAASPPSPTRDPLPGLGDLGYDQILRTLAAVDEPLVQRTGTDAKEQWHLDEISLTDAGSAVLEGRRNWLEFSPPERWVGGVYISATGQSWHWDAEAATPILH